MTAQERIRRLSTALWWLTGVLIVVLPVAALVQFGRGVQDPSLLLASFPGLPGAPGPAGAAVAGLLGACILVPLVAALAQVRALFARYRAGEVLTDACALRVRRAGMWLGVLAVVQVAVHPAQTVALTWHAAPGQRMLAITLTGETLWLLLAAGLLATIGHAMHMAAEAAEDARGFV